MKNVLILFVTTGLFITATITAWSQEPKEKSIVKIALMYTRTNAEVPVLKIGVKIKSGKKYEPLEGAEIKVSFMEETPNNSWGKVVTDHKGNVNLALPDEIVLKLDSMSSFKFIASLAAGDRFNETTTEIEITPARIELTLEEADSTRKINAKLKALKDGQWTEIPDAEVKIVIKRLFSDLPVGEDTYTTNESGEVSTDFVISIPGDANGNILLSAKLDENETYGTISAVKSITWGIPAKPDTSFYERSLWASRDKTPLWMLIFPNAIIATVWGFIFYLIYLIIRIRKAGIVNSNKLNSLP